MGAFELLAAVAITNLLVAAVCADLWRGDAVRYKQLRDWLDDNTMFYDVDPQADLRGRNVPALAQVASRVWYHATFDRRASTLTEVFDNLHADFVSHFDRP